MEKVLEDFYRALLKGSFKGVHIPRSDVFYVREAIFCRTGIKYSLEEVEQAMYLEGFLNKKDIKK